LQKIDFIVLFAYLILVVGISAWAGRRQTSASGFFLGDRNLPWWMVMFSVVATETSVLTFLSIPGVAYNSDLGFLQLAFGYIIGRWIIAQALLPTYFHEGIESTYEFIRNRWGSFVQRYASLVFLGTRILADGVRLFMTAIPLSLITGWTYPLSIAIIGLFTLIYTLIGGIRSVIWADTIQFGIYLLAAVAVFVVLDGLVSGGWSTIFATATKNGKLTMVHFTFNGGFAGIVEHPYQFLTAVIGGMFLSMASHGTDHLMVQRLLSCRGIKGAQKALVGSGILAFIQFGIFLMLGTGIWVFYYGRTMKADEVFSKFIIEYLPAGLTGFIVAGIFSAAMSTLSSSINALASSTMTDWFKGNHPDRYNLTTSRLLSVFWAVVLVGGAMLFTSKETPLVEVGLSIASFTYGGLLGFFYLGRKAPDIHRHSVTFGFTIALLTMVAVVKFTSVAWPLYTVIGLISMVIASKGFEEIRISSET
jgi:SSS family transporter